MEQSEGFKKVQATIQELERRLKACENINQVCEQSAAVAEKEIEEHFAKCFNALAARKDALLKEVAQQINKQKKGVADLRVKLESSIEACNLVIKAATAMNAFDASTADNFCKGTKSVPVPNVFDGRVTTELPISLVEAIQAHGKVDISSRFSVIESVTTFAGSEKGNVDGNGLKARFNYPWGICLNPSDGCVYVCDRSNHAIRKLTTQGDVSAFVSSNGLNYPSYIAMNYSTNSFFVSNNAAYSIVKISANGTVSPFAGSGQAGKADGVGTSASFNDPRGIAIDQCTGNIFVCDCSNHLVRKITPQGEVSTLAGLDQGFANGNGKSAKFNAPWGICFDESSNTLLVCDYGNNKLRRLHSNGDVSTVCEVPQPVDVSIAPVDKVIIVSSYNHRIYKVTQIGQNYESVVIAGTGKAGRVDGRAHECGFNRAYGILVHEASHSCLVAESGSHAIRKISFASPNV